MKTVAQPIATRAKSAANATVQEGFVQKEREQTHLRGAGSLPSIPWSIPTVNLR